MALSIERAQPIELDEFRSAIQLDSEFLWLENMPKRYFDEQNIPYNSEFMQAQKQTCAVWLGSTSKTEPDAYITWGYGELMVECNDDYETLVKLIHLANSLSAELYSPYGNVYSLDNLCPDDDEIEE